MIRFVNESIKLMLKLDDGVETLYPEAKIYDSNGFIISTVSLSHTTDGIYLGTWSGSSNTGEYFVSYIVYTDSNHTTQSEDYSEGFEEIFLTSSLNTIDTNVDTIVAKLPTNYIMGSSVQTDKDDEIDAIKAKTDNLPTDPASESQIETAISTSESNIRGTDNDTIKTISDQLDAVQTDLDNPDQYKADVSSLALESNIETHVTNSLNSYDPPTRAELTSDKNEIIAEIDNNETKIDTIDSNVDGIKTKTDTIAWDDITFIKDIEGGRWIRDGTQMKFYKSDNSTLVATFNLKKADGTAAGESDDVYERVRA